MMFLDALKSAADEAEAAEARFHREAVERTRALEQQRVIAYRRLNLMRAVADAMGHGQDEAQAVASAVATVRSRVGWEEESETRTETLARFRPVAHAAFSHLAPPEAEIEQGDVARALAEFEGWYLAARGQPFWNLFDQYVPELPLVER